MTRKSYLSGAVSCAVEAAAQGTSTGAHDPTHVDFCLADSLKEAIVIGKS